jgi:hypothetical protein
MSTSSNDPLAIPAFRLKKISFFQRDIMVLCQNANGPCPLIAITNILLLKGRLTISTDISYISLDEIVQMVAEIIFEESDKIKTSGNYSNSEEIQLQQTLDDVFTILPKLAKGLDLNIMFNGVNKYEFTQEVSIFDILQIPLLHGWIYDTRGSEEDSEGEAATVANAIGDKSYNHLIFKMVDYQSLMERLNKESQEMEAPIEGLVASLKSEEQELYHHGLIINNFMNETASQLTEVGLIKLYEFLSDRHLAVFFRNNHFSTLFSYNGQLFLLITDLGYSDQEAVVWELLVNVNG